MTTKHEIEIPDLPEGWRAVAYRAARRGIDHVLRNGQVTVYRGFSDAVDLLIVEKIKPRRIILEETSEIREVEFGEYFYLPLSAQIKCWSLPYASYETYKIWRVIEEE